MVALPRDRSIHRTPTAPPPAEAADDRRTPPSPPYYYGSAKVRIVSVAITVTYCLPFTR